MRTARRFLLVFLVAICGFSAPSAFAEGKKELLEKADAIAAEVSSLRGLKIKKTIRRGVMNKAQIRKRIVKLIDKEYTPAELEAEELGLKRLGLIPESAKYLDIVIKMLEDQIAGFYDPFEKQLYVASWTQMGGDELMAHEIDHALQDQHFDLQSFMKPDRDNGDSVAARQALVEGDGMAIMLEFALAKAKQPPPWGNAMVLGMLRKTMASGMGQLQNVPLALREGLVFPYIGGLEFVAHFRKHHPWTRVDAIYRKPPLSTEHILHPDKYESYEKPHAIAEAQPKSLVAHKRRLTTVQGEKGIELFLRQHGVEEQRAIEAAAGWGGDRFAVYTNASQKGTSLAGSVGVLMTSWDQEADAREYFEALEHALPKLTSAKPSARKDVLELALTDGTVTVAERKKDRVVLILAAPAKSADALRTDVWQSWAVR